MIEFITRLFKRLLEHPLKVAMISCSYPHDGASISGSAMHSYYLSRNLANLGCEVHVFCKGDKDKIIKEKIGDGKVILHILRVNLGFEVSNEAVLERLYWYTFETRTLNLVMYENSKRWFDIIHSQSLPSVGFMLKHFSNMNWVHTFHSLDTKRLKKMTSKEIKMIPLHNWTDKTVLDADRLIVVSNKFREEVIREIKGVARNTVTIPNGVDLDIFNYSNKNPPTVLYLGRFSKEKGIELIPEIAEKILEKSKRYKFIVAAKGNIELPELKIVVEKFNELSKKYPKQFIWHKEALEKEKVAELIKNSGICIQPSSYETFGLTVLEAMACGKTVVVSDVGGMPELVGKTGVVTKSDANLFSKKILKLLTNPKLRKKYGKAAAKRALEFEWKLIAKETLKLYKKIIEGGREKK